MAERVLTTNISDSHQATINGSSMIGEYVLCEENSFLDYNLN